MPICKECNVRFPNRVDINGKVKFLNRRKFCLKCHPLGTKRKVKASYELDKNNIGKRKICSKCEKVFVMRSAFHKCNQCYSCLDKARRYRRKLQAIEYKGGCCQACKYKKCIQALVFHHLDPMKKDFGISGQHCLSWERVKNELDKCVLLCHNCHTEIHAGVRTL